MRIIRVFPRHTSMTPMDDYAFVGDPPMLRPEADEVHISVSFTWDIEKAKRLREAWQQYYPIVKIGGPALDDPCNGFEPSMYIRQGVTFTSRGCNERCPPCLAWRREGKIRELPIYPAPIIQDNNVLQCNQAHIDKVFMMLRKQYSVVFSGGLDSRRISVSIADDLRSLRVKQIFLACDSHAAIKPLFQAVKRLQMPRDKLRCYVLLGFNGETLDRGIERLEAAWQAGTLPFAMLYQPPDKYIKYPREWQNVAYVWMRPAATKAIHRSVD